MSEASKQLSALWLILASLAVLAFGLVTAGLWIPAVMMFDAPGSERNLAVVAFAVYSAAGPVAALFALLAGWYQIARGNRASGIKWMIATPLLWLIGLLGWFLAIGALCNGQLDCSA